MYPDDRVLVGVINRKRDFIHARDDHWYRIPQTQASHGIYTEYLAFFLSGAVFKEQSGAIHYYARRRGIELARRRDLLPEEAQHTRADLVYYKIQIDDLLPKVPPIVNTDKRVISFIYTTWDRFIHASKVSDLYSVADYYVDRIYHALKDKRYRPDRLWEIEQAITGRAPELRIKCKEGDVVASTAKLDDAIPLDDSPEDEILAAILAAIRAKGGPVTINIPVDGPI